MSKQNYSVVGLLNPKTPANVGSVLRAAQCYGATAIVISGRRYVRAPTDTGLAYKSIPVFRVDDILQMVPFDCVPVAVELLPHAVDMTDYAHPRRAYYIFGPEDGTLGKAVTDHVKDVIYIPTTHCMNLAATVNVVLYDRMAKIRRGHMYG